MTEPEIARLREVNKALLEALKWAAIVIRPGSDLRTKMDTAIALAEGTTDQASARVEKEERL